MKDKSLLRERARRDYTAARLYGQASDDAILYLLPVTAFCPGCKERVSLASASSKLIWALVVYNAAPRITLMHEICIEPAREFLHVAETWPATLIIEQPERQMVAA